MKVSLSLSRLTYPSSIQLHVTTLSFAACRLLNSHARATVTPPPHYNFPKFSRLYLRLLYNSADADANEIRSRQTPVVTSNNPKLSSTDKRQNQPNTWPSTCLLSEANRLCNPRRYLPDWETIRLINHERTNKELSVQLRHRGRGGGAGSLDVHTQELTSSE